ncbi:hypothetical protein G6F57_007865 [Rhizopus arrhizus]|uniref:Transposase n=1 Tax=Rhizopus oryzae TaxID=64495 RepID=A0A9P6X857_RHIOR|nr:hypothetical protein G6F23_008158 [Rhizopus arrhizus]KAG0778166.1 hypothetical protein G6F22_011394 [Rhizopus arrhizus]KAG0789320.1 hypothetical protein G6F21_006592 [Rhizopus arrhizus]KAG0819150.1 hypothetical protein G6F20_000979 [Rhizopus arrhizus]KAG0829191.1 hypothetical protein G6F18_008722 [Rhizopus arrhizus]
MSESGNDYEFNDQNKFQMYKVLNAEVSNQVQEPQVNIVEEKRAKKKTTAKEASKKEEALEVDNAIEKQSKKNQYLRKMKEEHTKFLEEFIDNNPVVTLDQMVDALSGKFEGFSISNSGVDKHLKESCTYTLKRMTKIPAKRNSPDVIEQRFRAVEAWIKDSNISFMQNCIFIDAAGFNLHTVRSQGRSKKGAICSLGVVHVGLKVTKAGTK